MGIQRNDGTSSSDDENDFEIISTSKKQACVLIFGYGGCGKTTFVTQYAPSPVALINFDRRADKAAFKANTGLNRVVHKAQIPFSGDILRMGGEESQRVAKTALEKTFQNFKWAIRESEKGNIRTICIDTGTELDAIMSVAAKGIIGQPKKDYGASKGLINRQWLSMFLDARQSNAHLVILSRASEIWAGNEPTGRYRHSINEVVFDSVDWAGQIRHNKSAKRSGEVKFEIEITKAGNDITQLGEIYTDDAWNEVGGPFVYSCWMNDEDSTPEDWK